MRFFLSDLQVHVLDSQVIWSRHFNVRDYSDHVPKTLNIKLPREMHRAVVKRKAEFIAGRAVALQALHRQGCDCSELPIGQHRAPIWPQGWIGSISHTDDLAMVTIAPSNEAAFLGLDVESLIEQTQLDSLIPMFISAQELRLWRGNELSKQSFATLVFSAKESIFKAVYPHVKTYLEFSDSELTSIDVKKREAYFKLCRQGEVAFGSPLILRVRFFFEQSKVFTLVCQ